MYFQSNARRGLMALAVVTTLGVFALPAVAQTTSSGNFGSVARPNLILIRGGGGGGGHLGGGGHFGGGGFRGAFGHVGTSTLGSHAMANGFVGGGLSHMSREIAGGRALHEPHHRFGWRRGAYGYYGEGGIADCSLMDPAFRVRPYLCE
jgi:hypothetical protein